ncbi:PspC domain-containing protein [Modestobacter sp. VKM Ac-2981]|uniref:PspC domain-containing protein n=1 Tax=Modestobacter sp. VKM Ac-2981 TaxID=3004135 RepID=UPI0022AA9AC2|nr:PspC domain-containing protein [Modestobacter sp. VKM Ac-2981]MCZ2823682.1 PspC domain-containing protein [Modestobacter sp. VKM Ac-2981]
MTSAVPPSTPPPAAEQPPGSWPPPPPPGSWPPPPPPGSWPPPPPPGSWPPPPPPGSVARPPLRRSRTDRVIGGVAGGLAEYTGVDALLWRVGAIALTLAGGSGLIIYVLLWLLMPAAPAAPPGQPGVPEQVRTGARSPVPGVTIAALLIIAGIAVMLDQFTTVDLGARGVLGSALLIVGVGLVFGALTGIGRGAKGGLIGLGMVLSVALAIAATVDVPNGSMGDRTWRPASAVAVQSEYENGVGDLLLDLRGVDSDELADLDSPITTRIDSGLGDIEVIVPFSADVQLEVVQGLGETDLFGDRVEAGFFPGRGTADWSGDSEPEFEITINAGLGDVEVSRG